MLFAPIHQEATFVHASQITLATHSEDALILTNVPLWRSLAEIMRFARMPLQDTTVCALKDTERSLMRRLHVNRPTLIFYVTVTLIAPTTLNALKVSASVWKVLKRQEMSAWTSTSAEATQTFAETGPTAKTFPALTNVNATPALSEHHHDCHARHHAKTSDAVHMHTASQKATKLFAFAKRAGLFFPPTYPRDASTSMSAMSLTDHLECAESTQSAQTATAATSVHVHQAFPAIPRSNVSISMNAHDRMRVVKMRFVRTYKAPSLAFALREQSLIPIRVCVASPSYPARRAATAPVTPFATPSSVASALNRTSATIAVIPARI